jgi:hypothetical protein
MTVPSPVLIAEVDSLPIHSHSEELCFINYDPMLQEVTLVCAHSSDLDPIPSEAVDKHDSIGNLVVLQGGPQASIEKTRAGSLRLKRTKVAAPTEVDQAPLSTGELIHPPISAPSLMVASSSEADQALQSLIQEVSRLVEAPILKTPVNKSAALKAAKAPMMRRSGRLVEKAQLRGKKTAEELAQDILCKKLEGSEADFNTQAQDCLTKSSMLPSQIMQWKQLKSFSNSSAWKTKVQPQPPSQAKRHRGPKNYPVGSCLLCAMYLYQSSPSLCICLAFPTSSESWPNNWGCRVHCKPK